MDPSQLAGIPPEDERKMTAMVESMQVRDSLRMYNSLVEKCFSNCVQSFRRKDLEKDEERVRLPTRHVHLPPPERILQSADISSSLVPAVRHQVLRKVFEALCSRESALRGA